MFTEHWVLSLFCPSVARFYQEGLSGEDNPQFYSDLFHIAVRQDIRRRRICKRPFKKAKTHMERLIMARLPGQLGVWLCKALEQRLTGEQRGWLVTTISCFDSIALHSAPTNSYWCGGCQRPLHVCDGAIVDLVVSGRSETMCNYCEFLTTITANGKTVGALHKNVVFRRRRNKSILNMPT